MPYWAEQESAGMTNTADENNDLQETNEDQTEEETTEEEELPE